MVKFADSLQELFAGRDCLIATMHHKEQVIAPLVEKELGVKTLVPPLLNTDEFGTFTRDIERPADQLTTARLKAHAALAGSSIKIAIASEGSFGPHPASPFIPCNREIVLLCDLEYDLEVWGETLSTQTNFSSASIQSVNEALSFARNVGFPDHGLVVRAKHTQETQQRLHKGITTESDLVEIVRTLSEAPTIDLIQVETDMRAMVNPTRMQVIAQATADLIRKLKRQCPECNCPGFDVEVVRKGLPCGLCGLPTPAPRAYLYICKHCQFEQEEQFPLGIETADPGTCSFCNP